jgi:hypothetical protein
MAKRHFVCCSPHVGTPEFFRTASSSAPTPVESCEVTQISLAHEATQISLAHGCFTLNCDASPLPKE